MRKNLKTREGITLIALIITIIVMLILVAVTISMAINGGLFEKAGEAVKETKNAINAEQKLADGKIEIDGVWYNSIDEYIGGKKTNNEIDMSVFYLQQINEAEGYDDYTNFKIIGNIDGYDLYYWYKVAGGADLSSEEELITKSKKYNNGDVLSNAGKQAETTYKTHVYIYLSKNNGQTIDSPILRFDPSSICFKENTLVNTSEGLKKIQDINIGDYVYSYNEEMDIVEKKEVLNIFKNRIQANLCEISVNNEKIICTTNHPFYSNGNWVKACELNKNDVLKNQFGKNLVIDQVSILTNNEESVVYNLEVVDNHNYFIGTSCILVHNAIPDRYICSYEGTIIYGETFEF